jgi:hypothetical protein
VLPMLVPQVVGVDAAENQAGNDDAVFVTLLDLCSRRRRGRLGEGRVTKWRVCARGLLGVSWSFGRGETGVCTTCGGGVSFYGRSLPVEGVVGRTYELVAGSGELGVRGFGGLESAGEVASEGGRT